MDLVSDCLLGRLAADRQMRWRSEHGVVVGQTGAPEGACQVARRHPRSEKNAFTSGGHESMNDHRSVMTPSLMWAISMAG